jgi:hypothetical protein
MIAECEQNVFITIGMGKIIIMHKVKTCIKKGESFSKVAKELRKQVADFPNHHCILVKNNKMKPSELNWGVYKGIDDIVPFIHSDNW